MKKIILIDGNNLIYRSYFATAYNGNFMRNSKNFPTNALFGFANMIEKIIKEEEPEYILVAFDKGKTFRHEMYEGYKAGRETTPTELKEQIPVAKEMLEYMGIKSFEIDNYEADDIIGTFAKFCDDEPEYIGTIISSDKDLLQLISTDIDMKLLKQKDYIRYNIDNFNESFGFMPDNIRDFKALCGDSSDNIPGVKGIGEVTATKLISEYKTLDNVYANIDNIKGKLQEKLISGKEDAYKSLELVTIVKDIDLDINITDIKYKTPNYDKLNKLYEELEFYSFIKKNIKTESISYKEVINIKDLNITEDSAFYIELDQTNYHKANIIGIGIYNKDNAYYISGDINLGDLFENKYLNMTYDVKKSYVTLKKNSYNLHNNVFDTMLCAYLLNYNIKDDISYLATIMGYQIKEYKEVLKSDKKADIIVNKAKFIYETKAALITKLKEKDSYKLYKEIEEPLAYTLGEMEYTGVSVDKNVLLDMKEEIKIKIELIENTIYNHAGKKFNISSPSQLGEVLFSDLKLPAKKKTKTGYSTDIEVLNDLKDYHPIINEIIEYRSLTKLYSTYIEGLLAEIVDNKIHTIYQQALTRTGRLSSIEPNLQNIPIRTKEGKLIRKCFVPSKDSVILSADYSQIELRILAHMSEVPELIEAFNNNEDIHTKTAKDIFKIDYVTDKERRLAKAVNFGIIYGISSFGLAQNTGLTRKEASDFMKNYFKIYPGVKEYMNKAIIDLKEDNEIRTIYGRVRVIDEINSPNAIIRKQGERMALNTPIQGTSADIIKDAMVKISNKFKEHNLKSKMILQVHDELIFDVKNEELETVQELVKDTMENVIKLLVPLKVDISTGNNWYEV
jgi:DNA polymerase-1